MVGRKIEKKKAIKVSFIGYKRITIQMDIKPCATTVTVGAKEMVECVHTNERFLHRTT